MDQESLRENTFSLKHLIVAEMFFLGISLWLVMALRSDAQVPLIYQSTFKALFALMVIGCMPSIRFPKLSLIPSKSAVTMMIVASVTAAVALWVMTVVIPVTGMKTLFGMAFLAALAGMACARSWKVISTARKSP